MWWPKDVWGLYADSLEAFRDPAQSTPALHCLNHLVRVCVEVELPGWLPNWLVGYLDLNVSVYWYCVVLLYLEHSKHVEGWISF
jgi:hypothetical protein